MWIDVLIVLAILAVVIVAAWFTGRERHEINMRRFFDE